MDCLGGFRAATERFHHVFGTTRFGLFLAAANNFKAIILCVLALKLQQIDNEVFLLVLQNAASQITTQA